MIRIYEHGIIDGVDLAMDEVAASTSIDGAMKRLSELRNLFTGLLILEQSKPLQDAPQLSSQLKLK